MSSPTPANPSDAVDVLWTGGWDSTFRVLQLALVEQRRIQPHYVIDTARQSSLRELDAMHEIRRELARIDPAAARRIATCRLVCLTDLADNADISANFERLKRQSPLGGQYDWLARYAAQYGVAGLELCIHVDDKAEVFLRGKVTVDDVDPHGIRLRDEFLAGDLRILASFRFPILSWTKTAMRQEAERHGCLPILERSWFCHSPIGEQPCGLCNPCIFTIEEDMGYRLPRRARLRYRLRWVIGLWRSGSKRLRKFASRALRAPIKIVRKLRGA